MIELRGRAWKAGDRGGVVREAEAYQVAGTWVSGLSQR